MNRCPSCSLWHEDGLCHRKQRVIVSSSALDPDRIGVGSSAFVGDMGSDLVRVPKGPTVASVTPPFLPAQQNRYLIRLCGYQIPYNYYMRLLGISTAVVIGSDIIVPQTTTAGPSSSIYVVEKLITSPFWTFGDGNVAFHLRHSPLSTGSIVTMQYPTAGTRDPGGSTTYGNATDSGLLFVPRADGGSSPYVAPGGGLPPGVGVGSLGTWRDVTRFPWNMQTTENFEVDIPPGVLTLWASVFQTDPATRVKFPIADFPPPFDPCCCLPPEDQFLLCFPFVAPTEGNSGKEGVRYRGVAGAIIGDIIPGSAFQGKVFQ